MRRMLSGGVLAAALAMAAPVRAADCFLGEVRLFAGSTAPAGWALAQGQLMPISQNTALFAILGTRYGGDGKVTFGLPDLRGRVALGAGQAEPRSDRQLGDVGGAESHQLTVAELPAHSHAFRVFDGKPPKAARTNLAGAAVLSGGTTIFTSLDPDASMRGDVVAQTGGNEPYDTMPPFQALNHIICIFGEWPAP